MTLSKTLLCIYIDSRAALHPVQADHAPIFFFQLRRHRLPFLFFNLQTQKSPSKYEAMHILAILALPARYGEDPFNNSGFLPCVLFFKFPP